MKFENVPGTVFVPLNLVRGTLELRFLPGAQVQ